MTPVRSEIKKWPWAKVLYGLTLVLWAGYAYLTLMTITPGTRAFHISWLDMDLLRLTILLPLLAIWLVAVRGAIRFKEYALVIRTSVDGRGLYIISNGLLLLVGYFMMISVLNSIVNALATSSYLYLMIAIRNHLPAIVALVALGLVYIGSEQLNAVVRARTWTRQRVVFVFIPFFLLAVAFSWAFYTFFTGADANGLPRYVLPKEVLMFSYVLPHLIGWFLGLVATLNIAHYGRTAAGSLYKQAFSNLSVGILGVLITLMVIQVFGISASALIHLPLGSLLILVYGLLILAGVGFAYIYRGARKMELLETAG